MEIKGKVHCFFEQSGTFKNEFIKLGIPAEDYDIQNNFGQTDHVVDLFENIQNAYEGGGASVFDNITKDDLIVAFFPCTFFCCMSQMCFNYNYKNYKLLQVHEITEKMIERAKNREKFFIILLKLVSIVKERDLKMVIENPWSINTFLKGNFVKQPDLIDIDRTRRGDCRIKPTAFWFFGFEPKHGFTFQPYKGKIKTHQKSKKSKIPGLCSSERSMITSDYARNFIYDFILGEKQDIGQLSLF